MKRRVDFNMDQYGEFVFEPAPTGQEPEWTTSKEELPTIDNDVVVDRYVKAKVEFEAASENISKHLVLPVKTSTPFPCSSCLYYKNATENCDICVVSNLDGTCNFYREDGYGI